MPDPSKLSQMDEPTYQDVFRENLRHLRAERGWRQDDLALASRAIGLRWTQATVAAIETNRRQVSLGEMWHMQTILNVPFSRLFETDSSFVNVEGVSVPTDELQKWVRGEAVFRPTSTTRPESPESVGAIIMTMSPARAKGLARKFGVPTEEEDLRRYALASQMDAEIKAARNLNTNSFEIAVAAFSLWGRGLTDERDRLVDEDEGNGGVRARRGWVTRRLLEELEERLRSDRRGKR